MTDSARTNEPETANGKRTDAAQTADSRRAGKGMPDKVPQEARPQVGRQVTPQDASAEASLAMPHERDQQTDMTDGKPATEIKQASRDLKNGVKDTSKSPEMDQTYKKLRD